MSESSFVRLFWFDQCRSAPPAEAGGGGGLMLLSSSVGIRFPRSLPAGSFPPPFHLSADGVSHSVCRKIDCRDHVYVRAFRPDCLASDKLDRNGTVFIDAATRSVCVRQADRNSSDLSSKSPEGPVDAIRNRVQQGPPQGDAFLLHL
jgi:hypothetical protein